jgi:predicted amidohydrolase
MKIALIQLNSTMNKKKNLADVEYWIKAAYQACQPRLIALPEMFVYMGSDPDEKRDSAEERNGKGKAIQLLSDLASYFKIYIHGGSLCERSGDHFYNTTFVFNPKGEIIATYRKINLFNFAASQHQYNEASFLSAGNQIVTYEIDGITFGCAICFDLRFCHIFQALTKKSVDVIVLPSAFTYETGKAHWEILCRARAIENQSFLLAPAQTGKRVDQNKQLECYGHSMVVDPWGNVVAKLEGEVGFVTQELDFNLLKQVRTKMPLRS